MLGDQSAGDGVGSRDRDLLPDHGADRDLGAVDVTGHAQPRAGPHQPGEQRVVAERVLDRQRVAVGVQEPAAALDGGGDVPQVLDAQSAAHVTAVGHRVVELEHDVAGAVRQPQRACVPARSPGLDPRDRVGREEGQHLRGGVRRADGEPQLEPAGSRRGGSRAAGAQLARRRGVDLADGVVELPDAGEPGRERHVGERHRRGLHQHPGGLGALCPRQRQRARTELGDEEPVEVAGGVADPAREPLDALALDDPVGDQPHRPSGRVGGDVPVGRARGGVGQAPLAGPEAGRLRRGRGAVERDVAPLRRDRRAGGPAVDAGRRDTGVEDAVEPAVPALHRPVAGLGVLDVHDPSIADGTDHY